MFKVLLTLNIFVQRRHSGVFMVKLKHWKPFPSLSIVQFEQVNLSWGIEKANRIAKKKSLAQSLLHFIIKMILLCMFSCEFSKILRTCFCGIHLASARGTCEEMFKNAKNFFYSENCQYYPYQATALFFYPLKVSENLWFSDFFFFSMIMLYTRH